MVKITNTHIKKGFCKHELRNQVFCKNQQNCEWSHDIPDPVRKRNKKQVKSNISQNRKKSRPNIVNTSSKSYETTNS